MPRPRSGGSRQPDLIPRSKRPTIVIEENHRLVILAEEVDWTELLEVVEAIRLSRLKSEAGRPPQLRALVGALLLRATRKATYRETEDLIRHYAPARYLCGLTETDWSPDHNTICDFETLLGEDGVRQINEYAVKWAVSEKLADPTVVVGDTTAQEAAVPYPNEMRLMASFMTAVGAASQRAGQALRGLAAKASKDFQTAKEKVRHYRLFAKTKAERLEVMGDMMQAVETVQKKLERLIKTGEPLKVRLTKYGKVARSKVLQLHETMKQLLPQIAYWHRTGFVAAKKIISLHIPQLYSIPRGKVGKDVEFGLNWGISRLRGGFLLARLATNRRELVDSKFVVKAVDDCIALFGKAPTAFAYDRAGHSAENVETLRQKGVKHPGLAPRGSAPWSVNERQKERLVKERALVEGSIGTIKSNRYGFNRPAARSVHKMGVAGQRSVLGFNINKLVKGIANRNDIAVVI